MKGNKLSIRLSPGLAAVVSRQAAERGITRTARAAHLIERGLVVEALERLLETADRHVPAVPAVGVSGEFREAWQAVVSAAFFTESLIQSLNAALNRSSAEVGKLAAAARDQAVAKTQVLFGRTAR